MNDDDIGVFPFNNEDNLQNKNVEVLENTNNNVEDRKNDDNIGFFQFTMKTIHKMKM